RVVAVRGAQGGDRGLALAGGELALGQGERGQRCVAGGGQAAGGSRGLFEIACLDRGHHAFVGLAGGDAPLVLALQPPLAAADDGQAKDQSSDDPEAVVLQPGADLLALFVLVEQFIQRHRLLPSGLVPGRWRDKRSDRETPGIGAGRAFHRRSRRYWPAGAMEPSEDTVKRATFARWNSDRS